jgi:hypothetical protein
MLKKINALLMELIVAKLLMDALVIQKENVFGQKILKI